MKNLLKVVVWIVIVLVFCSLWTLMYCLVGQFVGFPSSSMELNSINTYDTRLPYTVKFGSLPTVNEPKEVEKSIEYWNEYIESLEASQLEKEWLKDMVFCESTGRETAVNELGYTGLLQFAPGLFENRCDGSIWNGEDQIGCALKLYRNGEKGRWECNSRMGY